MLTQSCNQWIETLSSSAPVPGGGGASALVGAMGVALGSMVGNLTLGKKKYQAVEEDIRRLLEQSARLTQELKELVEEDARAFEPLSKAYGLPKTTPAEIAYRDQVMAQALREASLVPLAIMEKAVEGIKLQQEMACKGSRIAISDVGVGVQLLRSALLGASMNVFINTKLMKDQSLAQEYNQKADELIAQGTALADQVYRTVEEAIR